MRLGLFGGSFDPVHYGHLLLAESCREQCRLDEVWFVPAAAPPHKHDAILTPPRQRIEMLELAIGGHEAFRCCQIELQRGGTSYTVDTLAEIRATEPEAELFLLLGADSLADLPNWKDCAGICRLATPVIVPRWGVAEPDLSILEPFVSAERLSQIARHLVRMPRIELASSDMRRRVAAGLSIRYHTPAAVVKYIEAAKLYAQPAGQEARAAQICHPAS